MRCRPVVLLLLLVAAPAAALAQSADSTLRNHGAEEAGERTDPEVTAAPPYWSRDPSGAFTIVEYGASGFPGTGESEAIAGGARFFSGGPGGFPAVSTASQQVDLSQNAEGIDAGDVRVELSVHLGGVGADPDAGTVTAQFVDFDGALMRDSNLQVRQISVGPVTPTDRGNATRFVERSAVATVPAGARGVRVLMSAESRDEGEYINAFFDNVILRFPGAQHPVSSGGSQGGPGTPDGDTGGTGGSVGGGDLPKAGAPAALGPRVLRMNRNGTLRVRVHCTDKATCAGRLVAAVVRPRRGCGAAGARVSAGRHKVVPLRLSRVCRRLVRRSPRGVRLELALRLRTGLVVRRIVAVRRTSTSRRR